MAFVRVVVLALAAAAAVHLSAAWFLRSLRRERLEREWDAANPGGDPGARRRAVEEGVEAFRRGPAHRALALVYAVPLAGILYALFAASWN